MNEAFFFKFIKFGIVGVSGLAVDFGITFLLKEKIKANKYISSTIGFLTAATTNFILNRIWTFQSSDPMVSLQYLKFLGTCIVGVLLSNAIIWLLNGRLKWNFYFAKLLSIGIVIFWNFFASYFFTFNQAY
jgi:putative flippase GtrA